MKERRNVYMAYLSPVACAANKFLLSILNAVDTQKIKIFFLGIINGQLTAVTGVGVEVDVIKVTAIVGGTAVTPAPMEGKDPAVSNVTCVHTATSVTAGATLLGIFRNNDEIPLTLVDREEPRNVLPHPITCYKDQGITVKQITDSNVGVLGVLCLFEVEYK